ncbi:MAG: hypothetical protein IT378_00315 [Sandaracinaceae bacterium]|nr:hypothetical protein [Sandaracinaceae bacterium]
MSGELESLLVDPETREPVRRASERELAELKKRMRENRVRRHDGGPLPFDLEGALLTTNGKTAYAIVDGIPWMLVDLRLELGEPLAS